ncbi:hypothetical protein CEH78_001787 [Salmonella enterica]|nr:hypothetical protein [Salmonella enterica]
MQEEIFQIPEELLELVNTTQDSLQSMYKALKQYKGEVSVSCEKNNDADLLSAYSDSVRVTKELFDLLEKTRWLIDEHNIDCGPRNEGTPLSTVEEIDAWFAKEISRSN